MKEKFYRLADNINNNNNNFKDIYSDLYVNTISQKKRTAQLQTRH